MKIQVSFNYKDVDYQYTIDENEIDMTHYDDLWDYWAGENDNETKPNGYTEKSEKDALIFEICANKKFPKGKEEYGIISGESITIDVYNYDDDVPFACIVDEVIDVKYL